MAITLTIAELVDELRVGSSPEELAKVTRLHGYASEAVIRHASGATDAAHNEAVVRLAAYLYDQPSVTRADGVSKALRSSGAARILLPYRLHRAGTTAEAVSVAEASGSAGNPVIDVSVIANTLTVTYSDGTSASFPLAVGGGDAQSIVDSHAMEANAHHVPPAGVGQGITQDTLDDAIEAHTDAATAHHDPPTYDTELALKVERADVSAGVGIAISPASGSDTAFTISGTGSSEGPTDLQGTWTWRQNLPPSNGEVNYAAAEVLGEVDNWEFHAGTGYADARTQLLNLAEGDQVEIDMDFVFGVQPRHQLVTVTSTPTISGNVVTVSGRPDRQLSHQIPLGGQEVTVTIIPGPIQGVDQTARDAAADAADTAQRATDKIEEHVASPPPAIDTAARSAAANAIRNAATALAAADAAQVDIDEHEAEHPSGGGGGGGFVLGNVYDGLLPLEPVTMRIAWIELNDPITASICGDLSAVGDTRQTRAPTFPQAYLDLGLGAAVLVFWSATVGLEPVVYPLDYYEIVMGPGIPLTVDGEDGTYWKSDVVVSRHIADDRFMLQFPGLVIASEVWVDEQLDALPDGGGGGDGDDAYDWATEGNDTPIPADKLTLAPGGDGTGDDAYDWATEGNDDLPVPTGKVNLDSVQSQIDDLHEQIAHSEGAITAVVGQLGAGNASLRYTLPTTLNGEYDVSVRVKVKVQVNEFVNFSGNVHVTVDGGLGLNAGIPEKTHNYHNTHEATLNFLRKGLVIDPGQSFIDFTTLVTGTSPPDIRFIEVENMTLTNTSLVNASTHIPHINPAGLAAISNGTTRCSRIAEHSGYHEC